MLTYLRSAAVGVPDAALIPLWERKFPGRLRKLEQLNPETLAEFATLIQDVVKGSSGSSFARTASVTTL